MNSLDKIGELFGIASNSLKNALEIGGLVDNAINNGLNNFRSTISNFIENKATPQDKQIYSNYIKPVVNTVLGTQEDAQNAFNQAKPLSIKGQEMPYRLTPRGIITKSGNNYSGIDPMGAIGSLEDITKNTAKTIGYHISRSDAVQAIRKEGFNLTKMGSESGSFGDPIGAYFFPSDVKIPNDWMGVATKSNTLKNELNVSNPFEVTNAKDYLKTVFQATGKKFTDINDLRYNATSEDSTAITNFLKNQGFDSLIDKKGLISFKEPQIIVFDPKNIGQELPSDLKYWTDAQKEAYQFGDKVPSGPQKITFPTLYHGSPERGITDFKVNGESTISNVVNTTGVLGAGLGIGTIALSLKDILGVNQNQSLKNSLGLDQEQAPQPVQSNLKPAIITIYNPNPRQTDSTPHQGGFMTKMQFGDIAVGNRDEYNLAKQNFIYNKQDTFVSIPELSNIQTPYGNGIFRVRDTMNIKYDGQGKLDIFIPPNKTDVGDLIRHTSIGSYEIKK